MVNLNLQVKKVEHHIEKRNKGKVSVELAETARQQPQTYDDQIQRASSIYDQYNSQRALPSQKFSVKINNRNYGEQFTRLGGGGAVEYNSHTDRAPALDTAGAGNSQTVDVGVQNSSSEDSDGQGQLLIQQIDDFNQISEYAYKEQNEKKQFLGVGASEYPTLKTRTQNQSDHGADEDTILLVSDQRNREISNNIDIQGEK